MTRPLVLIALGVALALTAFACTSVRQKNPPSDLYRGVAEVLK